MRLYREPRRTLREAMSQRVGPGTSRIGIYGTSEAAELALLTLPEVRLDVAAVFFERTAASRRFSA